MTALNHTKTPCPLCEGTASLVHAEWPGYQQPHTFKIYHCPSCNTSFSLPIIDTAATYNSIYKSGKSVPGYSRYWEYMQAVKNSKAPLDHLAGEEDIYWGVKKAIESLAAGAGSPKIIEIGSGLGYLTYSLNKAGYTTTGLDISETAVQQAVKTYGEYYICADLFAFAEANAGTFDIAVFTEVIEHVPGPLLFTEAILKLLKPGGYAVITTPNKSLYPADIVWQTENPPIHFWWFSEDSLRLIAEKNSARISFVSFREFYRTHYMSVDIQKCREAAPMKPVLNETGDLVAPPVKRTLVRKLLRVVASGMPAVKKNVSAIRQSIRKRKEAANPDIIVCGDKGKVICAILEKAKQ